MANPANIVDLTEYKKYTLAHTLSTTTLQSAIASSNYSYTITNLTFHNYSSSQRTITVLLASGSGSTFYLANAMAIPSKASLILASKENPIHLYSGSASNDVEAIQYYADANSSVNAIMSLEYWYDPT